MAEKRKPKKRNNLLIATQNHAVKERFENNIQKNSKCRLCDDGDETVNRISKYNKLAQKKYKNRLNELYDIKYSYVIKIIYVFFYNTNKLYGIKYSYLIRIFLTDLYGQYMESWQIVFHVRVDLGIMSTKKYSKLHRVPELEPYYQMQFTVIPRTSLLLEGS